MEIILLLFEDDEEKKERLADSLNEVIDIG